MQDFSRHQRKSRCISHQKRLRQRTATRSGKAGNVKCAIFATLQVRVQLVQNVRSAVYPAPRYSSQHQRPLAPYQRHHPPQRTSFHLLPQLRPPVADQRRSHVQHVPS